MTLLTAAPFGLARFTAAPLAAAPDRKSVV